MAKKREREVPAECQKRKGKGSYGAFEIKFPPADADDPHRAALLAKTVNRLGTDSFSEEELKSFQRTAENLWKNAASGKRRYRGWVHALRAKR